MALNETISCDICGKTFEGDYYTSSGLCYDCNKEKEDKERNEWLSKWRRELTLGERVKKIENWIYEEQMKPDYSFEHTPLR